ncbi:MAG: class I SAM-dependent methyltransferase [Candidatus Nanopelagicales bacterium]
MDACEWNARYAASTVWSGQPNEALVGLVAGLGPRPADDLRTHHRPLALDLGCGEGADAAWLAAQGWDVVGVDWSEVALDRARTALADAGLVARFEVGDLTDLDALTVLSPTGTFDLITLAYLHPEPPDRRGSYGHLPDLMAPGGHLLVIAHDPEHGLLGFGGPDPHRLMSTDDVLGALDLPTGHEVLVSEVRARFVDDVAVAMDSVVLVHRLA